MSSNIEDVNTDLHVGNFQYRRHSVCFLRANGCINRKRVCHLVATLNLLEGWVVAIFVFFSSWCQHKIQGSKKTIRPTTMIVTKIDKLTNCSGQSENSTLRHNHCLPLSNHQYKQSPIAKIPKV
jgi:hypothetical protein